MCRNPAVERLQAHLSSSLDWPAGRVLLDDTCADVHLGRWPDADAADDSDCKVELRDSETTQAVDQPAFGRLGSVRLSRIIGIKSLQNVAAARSP